MDLKEISSEMRAQDNRSAQYPLFVIQDVIQRWDPDGQRVRRDMDYIEPEDLCEKCQELEDLDFDCIDCDNSTYDLLSEDWEFKLNAGVFFTAKACQQHIDENYYHYSKKVRVYGLHAWRNPEMVAVMQHILKLTGDDIPSHYK